MIYKRIIKINFDIIDQNLLKFVENNIYRFQRKLTNQDIHLEYIGKSRIDGNFLFKLDTIIPSSKVTDFEFNNIKIREVYIINDIKENNIGDHIPKYGIIEENQRKINEFLNECFKIDEYDLSTRDAHVSIIRDLKMKFILE